MLFSSLTFIFGFLLIVLFLYYVVFHKNLHRNVLLFLVSIIFYAWGEPKFVFVMLLSIFANYLFGLLVDKFRDDKAKSEISITLMIIFNIAIIFVFKYLMFFISSVNYLTDLNFNVPIINLPIGISFFTFQSMSYVIDIYRNKGKVQKNVLNVGLYIALFPQLVAGPIVRYETIADQIETRKENIKDFSTGCCRFLAGLTKKVLIANQMAIIADSAFNSTSQISVLLAWMGAIAYTFQIYYDFSGYSDMAIGLGKMFGFNFDENFNYPYISKSVTEFWRRWHISLSTWFRDYVYIPLGGSRVSKPRLVLNLFIVWTLTGIWHGASLNFILWGLYFFVFLAIEKLIFIGRFNDSKLKSLLTQTFGRIYLLTVIIVGWVLFRAETLAKAFDYMKTMFFINASKLTDITFLKFINEKKIFLVCALIFSMPICSFVNNLINKFREHKLKPFAQLFDMMYPLVYISLLLVCISYLIKGTYNPFIYFNF